MKVARRMHSKLLLMSFKWDSFPLLFSFLFLTVAGIWEDFLYHLGIVRYEAPDTEKIS